MKIIDNQNLKIEGLSIELKLKIDEINAKDEHIKDQYLIIENREHDFQESVRYAKRIQDAVLHPVNEIIEIIPDIFIFFRPRDTVSGDFYWIARKFEKEFVICADCTGHGIPGAFMSMMSISFLNELILDERVIEPDILLNHLRDEVIHALRQTGKSMEQKDGLVISVCVIDMETMVMEVACAYESVFIVRDGQLIEIEADKMPISIYSRMQPFTKRVIDIQKGDYIYLTTDGYRDQFGGPKNRKFMAKRQKELFVEIAGEPFDLQEKIVANTFVEWMGSSFQVDDVLVIGLKI